MVTISGSASFGVNPLSVASSFSKPPVKPASEKTTLLGRGCSLIKKYTEPVSAASSIALNTWNILLDSNLIQPIQTTLGIFCSALGVRESSGGSSQQRAALLGNTKLLIGLSIPCAIFTIGQTAHSLVKAKSNDERENLAYDITENVGWLGESTAALLRGLVTNELVAASVGQVVLPLSVLSAGLTAANLLKNGKLWAKSAQLLTEVKEEERVSTAKALSHIQNKDEYALNNHFNITHSATLKKTIDKVVKASKEVFTAEVDHDVKKEKKIGEFLTLLKNRITAKNFSNKLAILSVAVNLIGLTVLVLTTVASLGYSLLALASIIALVKFFKEKKENDQFSKACAAWDINHRQYFGEKATM